ncbi:MAG: hypothetical protein P4L31_05770 [Candidatus Babeliales bacterium]|nr:hypothetical protein [Candidatus Babeliales bacterium]
MRKNILLFLTLFVATSLHGVADPKAELLEHVKAHLSGVIEHLNTMNDLMSGVQARVGSSRDAIIQQLASQRNSFNKSMCADIGDITPRKKIIGFYVYQANESDAAIKKIQEHMDDVQKHKDTIGKLYDTVSNVGCNWAVNDQTTPELEATVDQAMFDYIKKLITDFNQAHCNAVGFGYIPAKK